MASLPVRDPVGDHLLTPQKRSLRAREETAADVVEIVFTERLLKP